MASSCPSVRLLKYLFAKNTSPEFWNFITEFHEREKSAFFRVFQTLKKNRVGLFPFICYGFARVQER